MTDGNSPGTDDLTTIEQIDERVLSELSRRSDPLGVVSMYVTVDPADRDAAAIDIGNRFRELRGRIGQESTASAAGTSGALERVEPEIGRLTSPAASGRARVIFAALGGDWVLRLQSQMPLPHRVVLDDGPFIHPLLELLDEGRPAGVVSFSADAGRLLEWRLGQLVPLEDFQRNEVEAPHERAGQIGGGPPGQFHTPMVEHRQSREQDLTERFLRRIADAVSSAAGERAWTRIVVSGGQRWTGVFTELLPAALRDMVIQETRVLDGQNEPALTQAVTELLHQHHREAERRLVEQVREAGLTGTAALGLSEVTAALNEGRVAHLVYDPEVRYTGTLGPDGALHAGEESGPSSNPSTPEPRLTERIIERALAHRGARQPGRGRGRGLVERGGRDRRPAAVVAAALPRW